MWHDCIKCKSDRLFLIARNTYFAGLWMLNQYVMYIYINML